MRILRLDLLAYGHFTDTSLDLSAKGLHLIHGPNEAGKSTTLRALVDLLYGIPVQTRDGFLHSMQKLRIGAHLRQSNGNELEIVRHKRRKNCLLDALGEPVSEERMANILGGVGRLAFESMFALDHRRLRDGGRRLLEPRSELGTSLFGAGLGRGIPELLARLRTEAGELFRPQARVLPLNKALDAYESARLRCAQLVLRPQAWKDAHEEVARSQQALAHLAALQDDLERERARAQRWQRVLPLLADLDAHERDRARLAGTVMLPEDATDIRVRTEAEIESVAARRQRVEGEIAALHRERQSLHVPVALLEFADRLDRLVEDAVACKRAQRDLPRAEAALASALGEVRATLGRLGHETQGTEDSALERGRALLVERAVEVQIQRLVQESAKLEERREGIQRSVELCDTERGRLTAKLDQVQAPGDWRALADVVIRVRSHGDLEARARDQEATLEGLGGRMRRVAGELGLSSPDPAAVARLPVPLPETVERFEERWRRIERETERTRERLVEIEEDAERTALGLEQLELRGALPTDEELARARGARDELWRRVRRAWLQGEGGTEPALGERFEAAVTGADDVADSLRREASRVAQAEELRASASSLARQRGAAVKAGEDLEAEWRMLRQEWSELWRAADVTPLTPSEMRGWLSRRAQLVELVDTVVAASKEHACVESTVQSCKEQLRAAIAACSTRSASGEERLDALLDLADALVERGRETEQTRSNIELALADQGARRAVLEGDLATAAQAREAWSQEWLDATRQIGLGASAGCDEATAVVEELRTLTRRIEQADEERRRVEAAERESAALAADVAEIVTAAAQDLAGLDPLAAADELLRRRRQADMDSVVADGVARRLAGKQEELGTLEERGALAAQRLQKLVAEAGCMHVSQLREVEQDSRTARQLDERIDALRRDILQGGSGLTLEALRAETQGVDIDGLPGRLHSLETQLRDNRQQQDRILEALGRQKNELERMDGSDAAAEAAAEAEVELARLRSLADRYVRSHLAACLLQDEVERYRRENQGPLVARAGELFARLTRHAYHALEVAYDERGDPVLTCLREGGEALTLEDLSDGTADQLYLALRLASLERQTLPVDATEGAESSGATLEPLPLVFDDALVHFDDDRSVAAFEVLAEIAEHTQVLFFTHHSRLRDLARRAIPGDRLREHDLLALRASAASVPS